MADPTALAPLSNGHAPTPEALQARIADARARLIASSEALKGDLQGLSDWKVHVRRHPVAVVAGALVVGALIGALWPRSRD